MQIWYCFNVLRIEYTLLNKLDCDLTVSDKPKFILRIYICGIMAGEQYFFCLWKPCALEMCCNTAFCRSLYILLDVISTFKIFVSNMVIYVTRAFFFINRGGPQSSSSLSASRVSLLHCDTLTQ